MRIPNLFLRFVPLLAAVFLFFTPSLSRAAESVLHEGDLVAVCGDSITEQKLYSLYIEQYLLLCQPEKNIMTMQFGWGGERASGLNARVNNDVLPFKPTVATTCYGMNDGGYRAVTDDTVKQYREAMIEVVKKLKAGGVRAIIVGSPGVVDTKAYKRPGSDAATYNHTLAVLAQTAREVAQSEGVLYADVYDVMMDAMTKAKAAFGEDYTISSDGVHPYPNGHLAMAYAFLKALGVDGDIGTLTVDYTGNHAVGTAGHRIIGYKQGVLEVESTRYPYCFTGTADGRDTQAMSAFIPFNEDLNRFRLVVQGAPAQTKVTWGSSSKTFTAAQLAAGINLAAEFSDNPFSKPFAEVTKTLQAQQLFETAGIKNMLNPLGRWRIDLPEGAAHYDALQKMIMDKSVATRAASRAAVKPVAYSITIEPAS